MIRMLTMLAALWLGLAWQAAAAAAALSERSPVRLGLWWDPVATGSGFEIFGAGEDLVLVWDTYRENGSAVWYTASGRFDAAGDWHAPLLEQLRVEPDRGQRRFEFMGNVRHKRRLLRRLLFAATRLPQKQRAAHQDRRNENHH